MTTVVIRFSSVGDIVLCASVTQQLAPVVFVTKPQYRQLAAALPGVKRVCCPPEDPLPKQAHQIIDLHASPRSRLLSLKIKGPVRRVKRYDIRRRARVIFKRGSPPPLVIERYAQTANTTIAPKPWISTQGSRDQLILCPFAKHRTKCWPTEHYIELAKRWHGSVLLLGSMNEKKSLRKLVDAIGSKAEFIAEQGFQQTLVALGKGRIAVGGDTGLMHLCAAAGIPVIMLFGPTTSDDGFWCHTGEALEQEDMFCRPCSRHGSANCPIGDQLCLTELTVPRVWHAVQRQLA